MEEVIIIGSGCAGLSAAIYAARAELKPLVIEGVQPGGQIITTSEVENFPSHPNGIAGFDLTWNMRQQAEKFGARIESAEVKSVDFTGAVKKIFCDNGNVLEAKNVIIAVGAQPRMTRVKGEAEMFGGKGISTCATCDGAFFRNQDVVVIGGGDTACEEADFLTRFCSSVTIIHRRQDFRASKIMVARIKENPKIKLLLDSVVDEFVADASGKCAAVVVRNTLSHEALKVPCKAAFLAIGHIPNTEAFKGQVAMDAEGFIIPQGNSLVKTNVANVYVAGDCSDKIFRQAITASAMGVMASLSIEKNL